jgi:hypothetical protein
VSETKAALFPYVDEMLTEVDGFAQVLHVQSLASYSDGRRRSMDRFVRFFPDSTLRSR